jgi:hypothetical protein
MAAGNIAKPEPLFDTVDWDGLCRLMEIPDDRREHFIWWLQNTKGELCYATKHATKPPEKPAGWRRAEKDIARGCRDIIRGIKELGALAKPAHLEFLETVGEFLDDHVRAPRRGAPTRAQRADRFVLFLENLLYFADGLGGDVTFNRKTNPASGNIVDLLTKLRPMMPPGLIPKDLHDHRNLIERLHTETRVRADPILAAADRIELLRGDLWRAMGEQEPTCPNCGQPVHWRMCFPISRSSVLFRRRRPCSDCGGQLPRPQ